MIVLDASAAMEWLLQNPAGARVEERLFTPGESLHAPHLLDLEVAQIMRRYVAAQMLTSERAQAGLRIMLDLPITRYPHDVFLWRVWELRHSLTAYDAVYVALAERLGAHLVTCDAKLATAPGHRARVEVLEA